MNNQWRYALGIMSNVVRSGNGDDRTGPYSIREKRNAVLATLFEKEPKRMRTGSARFLAEEEEVSYAVATRLYWDVCMGISEGSLDEILGGLPRTSIMPEDKTVQQYFIERAKNTIKAWPSDKNDEYKRIYKASARSNHPERASARVFRFLWYTAASWTLRKLSSMPTWNLWIPNMNKNLVALRQIANSNPTWIRSIPFMSFLILRCTILYINVTLRNSVLEQTGGGFSAEYIDDTRDETIVSLYDDENCIDFIITLVKERLEELRDEYADKWEVSEEKKNPHQQYFIARRDTYVGDIESLCEKTSKLIKGINRLIPLAAMLDSDTQKKQEEKLKNAPPTQPENEREQVAALLDTLRTLNKEPRNKAGGLGENAARIIDAMDTACKKETETYSSVATILRADLFSFLKCIVTVDAELHQDIIRTYEIGTASLRESTGLLAHRWWDEGPKSAIQALVTPSIMILMLGGRNTEQFDNALTLFLESIIVHRNIV